MCRLRRSVKIWLLSAAAAITVSPIGSPAKSAEKPSTYAAFVSALSALAVANDDAIQNERNAARLAFLRTAFSKKLLGAFPPDSRQPAVTDANNSLSLSGAIDTTSLLCSFRADKIEIDRNISPRDKEASITVDHLTTLSQQNYLSATAAQLQALAGPSDAKDIFSSFKELFATYQVNVSAQPTISDADRTKIRKSCEADLREFDSAYYGLKIPVPSGPAASAAATPFDFGQLAVFGPIGTYASTIIGIIQPVLVNFANLISDFSKKNAIRTYLSEPDTQNKLRDAGVAVARTQSDYLFAKRLSLAGQFAEQTALLTGNTLDLASKEIQATCSAVQSSMYRRGSDGAPSEQFRRCYSRIWKHFEPEVNALLKTAAVYDQLADAGDTSSHLYAYKSLMNNFAAVATDSGQMDVWDTVSRMLSFAGAVKTAVSSENVKKVQQALDALEKGK
jgi:hypothetical protein